MSPCAESSATPPELPENGRLGGRGRLRRPGGPGGRRARRRNDTLEKYEELLPEQFYEEFDKTPIAYWSTAPMEEHGLHNPLGTDFYQGYEVCLRAADISGGIVFPPVPIGPAGHPSWSHSELRSGKHKLVPPSFWTSRELCKQLYTEISRIHGRA